MATQLQPGFMVIGVVRAGTTWIWENLRQHPEIWLSPVKEISYFNRIFPIAPRTQDTGEVTGENRPNLLVERIKSFHLRKLGRYLRGATPGAVVWKARYFFGKPSPVWYQSLFKPAGHRLAGDVTPHYSALGGEAIEYIAENFPEVKLILILRDPLARDWSHAVHFLTRYGRRSLSEVSEVQFMNHFRDPSTRLRGDYVPMLERWEKHFPVDRLRVLFFDDICNRPAELFAEVCRYLSVSDAAELRPSGIARQVNASVGARMPDPIRRHLAEFHRPALEELAARFGEPVTVWLENARRIAEGDAV